MAQSLAFLLVHIIFSTKDRAPVLEETLLPELFAYLATVARNDGSECYRVGGVADHVHLAIRLNRMSNVSG
jgi:putative transposase